ncbi:MAG TPA: condensation domain-containing protein [Candidatus Saccharimonadia bacterium]|nr:condensation domain-containing protein [Candidatus Saccharimonadia bacterium]
MGEEKVNQSDIRDWLIAKIADILKCPLGDIGVEDNFTALGLDSLSMITLTGDLAAWLGRDLPATLLLKHPSIEEVAELLTRTPVGELEPKLPHPSRDHPLPATLSQERLLKHAKLPPERDANLVNPRFSIRGKLDVEALSRALTEMVHRHEMLRTTFGVHDGEFFQKVHPVGAAPVEQVDWSSDAVIQSEEDLLKRGRERIMRPMDVGSLPLFRVLIIKVAEEEHRLMFAFHHLLCDADALRVFYEELGRLYSAVLKGFPPALEPLEYQIADFAVWERDWLRRDGTPYLDRLAWWREYWRTPPQPPRFPFALTEPPPSLPPRASTRNVPIDLAIGQQAADLARQMNVTLYNVYFAAFVACLCAQAAVQEVAIGTYVSDRKRVAAGRLMGMFVSMVPVRAEVPPGITFRELVLRLREEMDRVSLHRELPFEDLVEHLHKMGEEAPQVQVVFQHVQLPGDTLHLEGTESQRWLEHGQRLETSGLSFSMVGAQQALELWTSFDGLLYDPDAVAAFMEGYVDHLRALLSAPEQKLTQESPGEQAGWAGMFGPG